MEKYEFEKGFRFKTPDEEIAFLRERLKQKEGEHPAPTRSAESLEDAANKTVSEYKEQKKEKVLAPEYSRSDSDAERVSLNLSPEDHDSTMEELLGYMQENGVKNTLAVVEKLNSPHISDDFHRFLVQYIRVVGEPDDIKEGTPLFRALHMKLYQVSLPSPDDESERHKTFKEMVSAMEQFYAGMLSIADGKLPMPGRNYFTIEIAISNFNNEIVLYASVPSSKSDLFSKQVHSVFPDAKIEEQNNDYNIFNEDGVSVGAYAAPSENPIYPLKTYDVFDNDPLNVILNVFSRLSNVGEGAAIQIVISPAGSYFIKRYGYALERIRSGVGLSNAIDIPDTFVGELGKTVKELFTGSGVSKDSDVLRGNSNNEIAIEQIKEKIGSTILNTNIRIVASADTQERAFGILGDLRSAFNQFSNTQGNGVVFKEMKGRKLLGFFKEFSYRTFSDSESFPLNLKELTTILHFPVARTFSPQLKEAKAGSAPAPIDLPKEGTLVGVNVYRGVETPVYMAEQDRLRHFYSIGQTGTGKTTLMLNMIVQDIMAGNGVCMIDPHGTDVQTVLANIPKERANDVVYFDPAYTPRPMGLNMLEYDERFPEQKTFVVDELLAIFNKLFDMEHAGGPLFEQYFRNSALLVMEHPESGNTLLEIGRVLSDTNFRNMKLSHNKNPLVGQFWENAARTTGEQGLANFVPYVTSKFDVFLSNEIMRPVVSQEKSAFNIRRIMDERKIFLVNLSKGRLGDINANLIGLILVGKILMSALSRSDISGKDLAPFYLYIDEFQNITTDSISAILSEARKYKLSLNIAHQFISQIDERIRNAVFGNVGSMAVFRVGAEDADFLEKQFEPVFSARDIMNLDNFNAYMKLLINNVPAKPFSARAEPPPRGDRSMIENLKELSYFKYGRPRAEVESEILDRFKRLS